MVDVKQAPGGGQGEELEVDLGVTEITRPPESIGPDSSIASTAGQPGHSIPLRIPFHSDLSDPPPNLNTPQFMAWQLALYASPRPRGVFARIVIIGDNEYTLLHLGPAFGALFRDAGDIEGIAMRKLLACYSAHRLQPRIPSSEPLPSADLLLNPHSLSSL